MDDPNVQDRVTAPVDVMRLRSILRGLRSRKRPVREWALNEAGRLDEPHAAWLDEMISRSFKEEAGRRRFWRFLAFYGSPIVAGFLVRFLARWVLWPFHAFLTLFTWPALWYLADRAAKRAFVLPEDGRTLWQQRRKEDWQVRAEWLEMRGGPDAHGERTPAAEITEADFRDADFQAFVHELTDIRPAVRDAARRKVVALSNEELLAAARQLIAGYEQRLDLESHKRLRISNVAFWLFVVQRFMNLPVWFLVGAGVLGLRALYYRDDGARRHLDALVVLLEELTTERDITVSLDTLA